jgi:hypothetical protein
MSKHNTPNRVEDIGANCYCPPLPHYGDFSGTYIDYTNQECATNALSQILAGLAATAEVISTFNDQTSDLLPQSHYDAASLRLAIADAQSTVLDVMTHYI